MRHNLGRCVINNVKNQQIFRLVKEFNINKYVPLLKLKIKLLNYYN